ncbi:MAG: dienelactone hydrolase family protein [Desulfovibrio sp.]|jgi:dienelactone hydrolase|nr:dienelactone hydrolase family protein [Desulfovibrio sp.]
MEIIKTRALSGELYFPAALAAKGAALVIMSSSAGVCDVRERFYARFFAAKGYTAFVVDSFGPRGIKETLSDQSRIADEDMEKDAYAAYAHLKDNGMVDPERIAVMGVSRGGSIALHTALAARRAWFSRPKNDFAAHICLVPPCYMQQRYPGVSGRPILFMLAGKDDFTGVEQARLYAERMREHGADITLLTYPEAHHAWEATGKLVYLPLAENYSSSLFWIEDDGRISGVSGEKSMTRQEFFRRRERWRVLGAHAGGGNAALKSQAAADIAVFLEERGIVPV